MLGMSEMSLIAVAVALLFQYLITLDSRPIGFMNDLIFGKGVAPSGWKIPIFTFLVPFGVVYLGGYLLIRTQTSPAVYYS